MRFAPIAVAVAAAMFSLSAAANEQNKQSQSGQGPSMGQEQKPSTESASAGGSATTKPDTKPDAPAAKTEGHSASGGVLSTERTAEPKSEAPAKQ